jgi:glycosyltransferase involved in cell wall biosynthesis
MHIVIDARIRRTSTGRYTDRLIEYLEKIDKTNRYTVLLQPDDAWEPKNPKLWKVVPCPYAQFSFNPLDQIKFTLLLKSLKPDLVHFTMTQQPLFYFGNIVTTTHDLTMLRIMRPGTTPVPIFKLKMALYKFLFWWSHKKSTKIIVPTNFVKEDLAKLQPFTKDKTYVTYEAGEPTQSIVTQKFLDARKPFIMYLGMAFPHKNLERLVDAHGLLLKKIPDLQLIFVGKREQYKEELEKYIATKPYSDHIITPGFLPDAVAFWLYQNCEAYVFPSLSEGFGLPALEAMSYGAPIVSSNASCLPEVYGDAAEYFDPLDVKDMADAIYRVIGDQKRRKELIAKSLKHGKKYSWKRMAEQTLEIYKSTVK